MEDDQAADVISYSTSTLLTPGGLALSDEKAEDLADILELQPVHNSSVPAVIEMVTWR